ncbi:MAG: hypothetical protein KDJ46_00245 [Rhodobiaceae bacterium]|nr:hypothetical protein [Rhodobiaceae bacterium]
MAAAIWPASAYAQQPGAAVSATNWDFGLAGGVRDGDGAFVADAMVTLPITPSTGLRLDGAAGSTQEGFLGGAAAHYFWRDPAKGLVGGFVAWGTADPNDGIRNRQDLTRVGIEGEVYLGNTTLLGVAGGQFSPQLKDGFFGRLMAEQYIGDNFMVALGGGWDPQREGLGIGHLEWQPGNSAIPGLTLFVDGAVGGNNFEQVMAGIRVYSGAPKSLKDRHRQDTFRQDNEAKTTTLSIGQNAPKAPPAPAAPPPEVEMEVN